MDLEAQKDLIRRRLLGRGLSLVKVGDLGRDLTLTADGKDLALVDGVANLAQSLSVAVLTPLGSDVFDTAHGFDGLNALADETTPLLQRERVRVSMVQLLRRDARVGRVFKPRLWKRNGCASTTSPAAPVSSTKLPSGSASTSAKSSVWVMPSGWAASTRAARRCEPAAITVPPCPGRTSEKSPTTSRPWRGQSRV
jgi:hypothetical protein